MGGATARQVIGRYAIYGKIASGGMASVHFGRLLGAAGFTRTVAIKRLHPHLAEEPEFLSTMIDEARLAARIHHPNVVPTLDVVASNGELLVVMEYVRGESVARLLRVETSRGRRVPLPVVSAIVIGALHGLHAAHEATSDRGKQLGIVHRDVSPQNILVGVDGVARVIDFGVAKAAGRLQTTREGVIKGKVAYMAPEQLASAEVTRCVDVYAMAVVLWEMLAGRRLFQAEGDAQLVVKALAGASDPPSRYNAALPAELDAIVMTGLERDPGARFATARDMAEALKRVVPPAFPTDVGEWVEEVAHEALAQRGTLLAEIESSSGAASVPPPDEEDSVASAEPGPTTTHGPGPADEQATVASQPSSLSVATPTRNFVASPPRAGRARALIVGVLGVSVLAAVGAAILIRPGGPTHGAEAAPASAPTPPAASDVPSALAPTLPTPSYSPAVADAPQATAASLPVASTSPPARVSHPGVTPKARPAPKPVSSFRFTQPD
jgi:serine/threonine protein kinase